MRCARALKYAAAGAEQVATLPTTLPFLKSTGDYHALGSPYDELGVGSGRMPANPFVVRASVVFPEPRNNC